MGNRLFRSMGNRLDPAFTPASGTITLLDVFEQITHVNALFSGALLTFSTPTTFRLAVHRSILTDPAPTCPPTLLSSAHLLLSAKTFHQHNTKVYVAMDSATNDRPVYTPLNNFLQIAFLSREITTVYENGANSSPSDAPHLPVSESETESERLRKLSKARADHVSYSTRFPSRLSALTRRMRRHRASPLCLSAGVRQHVPGVLRPRSGLGVQRVRGRHLQLLQGGMEGGARGLLRVPEDVRALRLDFRDVYPGRPQGGGGGHRGEVE